MLRFVILLIILIIGLGGGYLWIERVPLLEHFFSKRLNTRVSIQNVQLEKSTFLIQGLSIKNPEKSTLPFAFRSDSISIKMPLSNFFKKVIHMHLIEIKNPVLSIELYNGTGTDNNWACLLNKIPSSSENRKFKIDKLTIENLKFEGIRANEKKLSISPIPYVEFIDLGNVKPLTLQQLTRVLFQSILSTLTGKPYLGEILDEVTAFPQKLLDGAQTTLPLDQIKGILQESFENVRRTTKEAKEFLQDLFKN